jgi:PAS domain S-box-containing protein
LPVPAVFCPPPRRGVSARLRLSIRHMDNDADLDRILTSGAGAKVGSFRLLFAEQRWEWSDAVAAMHGYSPGEVVPTTDLLLAHKHPDDKTTVAAVLERTLQTGAPFSSRHRIIDTSGEVHHVVVAGAPLLDDTTGEVIGTSQLRYRRQRQSPRRRAGRARRGITRARPRPREDRAGQRRHDADLRHLGRACLRRVGLALPGSNTKVRTLAEHLVASMRTDLQMPTGLRSSFDHLLLGRPWSSPRT